MKKSCPIWTQIRFYKNFITDNAVTIEFFIPVLRMREIEKMPSSYNSSPCPATLASIPHAAGLSPWTYRYVLSGQHNVILKNVNQLPIFTKHQTSHKNLKFQPLWKIIKWSNTEYTFMWEQAELSGNWPFSKEHELLGVITVPSCKKAQRSHMERPQSPALSDIPG